MHIGSIAKCGMKRICTINSTKYAFALHNIQFFAGSMIKMCCALEIGEKKTFWLCSGGILGYPIPEKLLLL